MKTTTPLALALTLCVSLTGCKLPEELRDEEPPEFPGAPEQSPTETQPSALDLQLSELINSLNLNQHPQRDMPSIEDELAQLGKKLFFSKALGGQQDSACVSCHHPALGGADDLSLSVGVDAINPDLLGLGRVHKDGEPLVPRNAPTVFNAGLWDIGLFHDSRVESLNVVAGSNGSTGDIRTPDSDFNVADSQAGDNLTAAQARFPVTSNEEMRGNTFEAGENNAAVRDHLAARIGNYGEGENELNTNAWLSAFQQGFARNDDAQTLVTFDNIAHAIGEYERSMVFTNHPWQQYMDGDLAAMSESAKQGAVLFFTRPQDGGAGCAACHNGQLFSDQQHHVIAFPQIGLGKGDGTTGDDDFGRARESANDNERYHFRTASLLNLAVTAPYSHSGSMPTLESVVRHYVNPARSVDNYFDNRNGLGVCLLPQFTNLDGCEDLYPNAEANTLLALNKLQQEQQNGTSRVPRNLRLNDTEVDQLVSFLEALTDPCVLDRECLAPWIPTENEAADNVQLNAINQAGNAL